MPFLFSTEGYVRFGLRHYQVPIPHIFFHQPVWQFPDDFL